MAQLHLLLLLLSPDSLAGVSASVSMGTGSGVSDEGEVTSEVSGDGGVGGESAVNVVSGGDGCRGAAGRRYLREWGRWASSYALSHKRASSLAWSLWMALPHLHTDTALR